jgi:ABC-type nitrate/sulfonate/bicarbonate transport system substrate-binding protein
MRVTWAGAGVSVLRIALVVVPVVALASGCHVPGTGASGSASGSGPITVAYDPGIDNAPLQVAIQDDLFQQHGLNVVLKKLPSLDAVYQALATGQAQIAVGDYTGFFYEQANLGAKLQLIADGYDAAANSVAILTLPTSGITTPQQLEDGGVDTPPAQLTQTSEAVPYNIETLAAEQVLQNDGVSPSSVNWTDHWQPGNMIAALQSGAVKAILATEPYIQEAEQKLGAVDVLDASDGVTSGLPMSGYFSMASFANENPSAVQAFQEGLDQAQTDCAQRGPVQAVLPNLTGMTDEDAALITLGTYPASLNVAQVQRVASLMFNSGMISNQVNVSASGVITTVRA